MREQLAKVPRRLTPAILEILDDRLKLTARGAKVISRCTLGPRFALGAGTAKQTRTWARRARTKVDCHDACAFQVKTGSREHGSLEAQRVASDGQVLRAPMTAATSNPLCDSFKPQADDLGENGRSLGYLLRAGKFEFVNLEDLS